MGIGFGTLRWRRIRAATLAGMVVNPILPSLRDRELLFILDDADTRMIFVPAVFGRHDYAAMLSRVVAELEDPPEVVVVQFVTSPPDSKARGGVLFSDKAALEAATGRDGGDRPRRAGRWRRNSRGW